uniref:Suppressor of IKBKE 1 n=1 Tax=Oryzias latipes TaxID=8090 RepID=A0A3P9M1X7_ORYLA
MACTLEKVLGNARTLLERLKEHNTAAEGLIEQSGALGRRVQDMKEVGNALPDKHLEAVLGDLNQVALCLPHQVFLIFLFSVPRLNISASEV